jgi:hypothetical protein
MSIQVVENEADCGGRVARFGIDPEAGNDFFHATGGELVGGPIANLREEIGPALFDHLQAATRLEVFRVRSSEEDDEWKLVGGRHLSDDFRRRLVKVLLDKNSYLGTTTLCAFDPGVAYRFWKGSKSVDVLICFKCNELCFGTKGDCESSIFFGPARAPLVRLAKRALPVDGAILALEEVEKD